MNRAHCPPSHPLRRTKAESLRLARARLDAYRVVAKAGARLRQSLECVRAEYAAIGDLRGLDACATVSDQIAAWENCWRKAQRLERLIARLRGEA